MPTITKELLRDCLYSRKSKGGLVWGLDLRGDEFGYLGAEWGRQTLYDPQGPGWPLRRGKSTTDEAVDREWLEHYANYLERERLAILAKANGMLLVEPAAEASLEAVRRKLGDRHNTVINRADVDLACSSSRIQ